MDQFQELDSIYMDHFGTTEEGTPSRRDDNDTAVGTTDAWSDHEDESGTGISTRSDRLLSYIETREVDQSSDSDADVHDSFMYSTGIVKCSDNCIQSLNRDTIEKHRLHVCEMEREEKDMYIMGTLQKFNLDVTTKGGKRKRLRFPYSFQGQHVCRSVFCYAFDIGKKYLKNLQHHIKENGSVPRTHGNKGRKPHHALQYAETKHCVDFIVSYAGIHGLPQPAAPRGRDEEPPVYLPSSLTKAQLHSIYKDACVEAAVRQLGITSFKDVWKSCVPHIKISTPKDDVCQRCEIARKTVADAVTEEEKLLAASSLQIHIEDAQRERKEYRDCVVRASEEMAGFVREAGPIPPLHTQLKHVHYTFDYSQMITLPQHSRQMGPMYFISGRKVQLFGIRIDGVPVQYNYLIDEDESIGTDGTATHGPNAVISMLDHCLFRYGFGERRCVLHADNCGGQNKNRFVIAYLCWRIQQGLHEDISLLMQIPGHTRCLVDSGFAHIKKLFRRTDCDSLEEFVGVVEKSATSNKAVVFRNADGEQTWIWQDWKCYLKRDFLPVKGIQKLCSFRFTVHDKDAVYVKRRSDGDETRIPLLRRGAALVLGERPPSISPGGLTRDRQQYLYKTVRPYVRPLYQHKTCPHLPEE